MSNFYKNTTWLQAEKPLRSLASHMSLVQTKRSLTIDLSRTTFAKTRKALRVLLMLIHIVCIARLPIARCANQNHDFSENVKLAMDNIAVRVQNMKAGMDAKVDKLVSTI